jgi:hypothetical protein
MANLAVSSFLTAWFVPCFILMNTVFNRYGGLLEGGFGLALCKLLPFIINVSMIASVYTFILIVIQHFYAMTRRLKKGFSRSWLKYTIPGIWGFAAVMVFTDSSSYRLVIHDNLAFCQMDWTETSISETFAAFKVQYLTFFVLISFLPFLVQFNLTPDCRTRKYEAFAPCLKDNERKAEYYKSCEKGFESV